MQVVDVYSPLTTGLQHCCSICGGSLMPRYPGDLDVVAELFLEEEHTPIEQIGPGVVKGDNVLLLDHVERAKVKRYLTYKCHISQGRFYILITMHHHINAAEQLYLDLPAITNDHVFFVGTGEPLVMKQRRIATAVDRGNTMSYHNPTPRSRMLFGTTPNRKSVPLA